MTSFNYNLIVQFKSNLEKQKIWDINSFIFGQDRDKYISLEGKGGVYVFWWTGDIDILKVGLESNSYYLKGPHSKKHDSLIKVDFSDDWLKAASSDKGHVCLYVGKSTNLRDRIRSHIRPTTETIWKSGASDYWPDYSGSDNKPTGQVKFSFGKKPNTDSQLRIGLERIFRMQALGIIRKYVGVSFIELNGDEHAINRFFIEDKTIADLYPLLNIDVER